MKQARKQTRPSADCPMAVIPPAPSGSLQNSWIADSLSRGGQVGFAGFVIRYIPGGPQGPAVAVDRVESMRAPVDRATPQSGPNEGATGIRPAPVRPDRGWGRAWEIDWTAAARRSLPPDASQGAIETEAQRLREAWLSVRCPAPRRSVVTGVQNAAREKWRAESAHRRARETGEAVNLFLALAHATPEHWSALQSLSDVEAFAPVSRLLALCPLVTEAEAVALLLRIWSQEISLDFIALRYLVATSALEPNARAVLSFVRDTLTDWQHRRALRVRLRIRRARKRKRRGKKRR